MGHHEGYGQQYSTQSTPSNQILVVLPKKGNFPTTKSAEFVDDDDETFVLPGISKLS
jgi:hypothetical protein